MTSAKDLAASWWVLAGNGLLEGTLALAVLLVLWWPLRRRLPARLVCILFLLPLLKVALPVHLPVPAMLSPQAWFAAWRSAPTALTLADLEAMNELAATAESTPAATAFGVCEVLCGLWLAGVLFLTWRFVRAQRCTRAAVRAATPIDPTTLPIDLHALRARASVWRRVRWLASDHVATPATGGVFTPYILLPRGFAERLPPAQLTFVLLHELAHVRRFDVAVALVQRLVQIVWFFHPAVWLANWFIDQHREIACDQDARWRSRVSRRECGEAFLSVAAWMRGRANEPTATLAMFDSQRVLKRRLMQILSDVPAPSRLLTAAYLFLATALTLPSAKANDGVDLDVLALAPQDDGQREEVAKLRKQIAELRAQLNRMQRDEAREVHGEALDKAKEVAGKLKRAKKARKDADEEEDDDDDEAHEMRGFDLRGHGKQPSGFTFRTGGKGAKAFVVEGGEVREIEMKEGKPLVVEGKPLVVEGKPLWTKVLEGVNGDWKTDMGGSVKVWIEDDGKGMRRVRTSHAGDQQEDEGGDSDGEHKAEHKAAPKRVKGMRLRAMSGGDFKPIEVQLDDVTEDLPKVMEGRWLKGSKLDHPVQGFGQGGVLRIGEGDDSVLRYEIKSDDGDNKAPKVKVWRAKTKTNAKDNEDHEDAEDNEDKAPAKNSKAKAFVWREGTKVEDVEPKVIRVRAIGSPTVEVRGKKVVDV